jgi:magnesium-transporting ATPase (P-type)
MNKTVENKQKTLKLLTKYASSGLRTLVVAAREIPRQEYNQWSMKYKQAKLALKDRK